MSFSTDMAKLVADQLSRFVTLNTHQLAGQAANLDFWLGEVRHALTVIDGYGVRFLRLEAGQEQYVTIHGTTLLASRVGCFPTEQRPPRPRRIPDWELQKARRGLREAASRFLERCRRDELISDQQLSEACRSLDIE